MLRTCTRAIGARARLRNALRKPLFALTTGPMISRRRRDAIENNARGVMLRGMLEQVLKTIDGRTDQSLAALKEFLAIPSVSTKPEHGADMLKCATWLADQLKFGGFDVSVMPTGGHPAVVAKNRHEAGRPTVLVYGHYDVQPVEPLELWKSKPFEPTVRDGAIYA